MAVDTKFRRVAEDARDRCQAVTGQNQCPYGAVEGCSYCPMHGGMRAEQSNRDKAARMYNLAKWQSRVEEFADHSQVKSLREEIGILRLLMEQTFDQCNDPTDLLIHSGKISDLVMKVEKVVASCHRLEASTGALLDKSAAVQLAGIIVEIIGRHVEDQEIVDMISHEIMLSIVEQKPDLKVEKKIR